MKRLLSIICTATLIISMFSGVVLADSGSKDVYTFTATPSSVDEGSSTAINITTTITNTSGTADMTDVNNWVLGIYDKDSNTQQNGGYITATLNNLGQTNFDAADISSLSPGIYYIKVSSGVAVGSITGTQNQYIEVSNPATYNANDDATIVVAVLNILSEEVATITKIANAAGDSALAAALTELDFLSARLTNYINANLNDYITVVGLPATSLNDKNDLQTLINDVNTANVNIANAKIALGTTYTTPELNSGDNVLTWAEAQVLSTGATVAISSTDNINAIKATGEVKRQLTQVEVNVTFTLTSGSISKNHVVKFTINKKTDQEKVDDAVAAIGNTYDGVALTTGDNILPWAEAKVTGTGATVTFSSSSNAAINGIGEVTQLINPSTGNVSFRVFSGSIEQFPSIPVTISAREKTDQEKIDEAKLALGNTYDGPELNSGDSVLPWAEAKVLGTGATVSINTTDNTNAVKTTGEVKRQLTQVDVDVTFTLTSGINQDHTVTFTIPVKTDQEKVDDAVAAIGAAYDGVALNTGDNILPWAQNKANGTGATVSFKLSSNAAINGSGQVTRQPLETTDNVTFTITTSTKVVDHSVSVTVLAHEKTSTEKLTEVKSQIPATHTATNGQNLVSWVDSLITDSDVNVSSTVNATANRAVSSSGIATFKTYAVTGNVIFTLNCGGETEQVTVNITVPKIVPISKIDLDGDDQITHTKSFGYTKISGKILDYDNNYVISSADSTIKVYKDVNKNTQLDLGIDTLVDTQQAENGTFSFYTLSNQTGQFIVAGVSDSDAAFINDNPSKICYDTFRILPRVELTNMSELAWTYPQSGQVTLMGTFPNEDSEIRTSPNATPEKLTLNFIIPDSDKMGVLIQEANYADEESFGFLVNGSKLNNTLEIGLFYGGLLLMRGEIKHGELNVDVTDKVVNDLGEQDLVFKFNLDDDYIYKSGSITYLESGYKITYSLTNDDDTVLESGNLMTSGQAFEHTSDQIKTLSGIDFTDYSTGTYYIKVSLYHDSVVLKETDLKFKVTRPSSYNLINWHLDEVSRVGKIQFELNKESGLDPETNQSIVVRKDMSSSGLKKYLEVIIEGCGVDEKFKSTDYDTENGTDKFFIETTETGTLEVTINVYSSDTDTSPNKTFYKEIEVKGWNIEVYPSEVLVDKLTDFKVIVTDENGDPVNNAKISINGETSPYIVNGTTHNIIGGVYKFEEEFTSVGPVKVEAVKGSTPQVSLLTGIEVLGEEVYSVTCDKDILLNAFEEYIYVTIIDDDGDIVYPTFERIDITKVDGKDVKTTGTLPQVVGSRKDLDGDGVKEAVKLKIKPTSNQHTMIIRALTDSGKQMGEVEIPVQPPEVIMKGTKKLTENFESDLEFKVIDPRDNSIIDEDVYFVASDEHIVYTVKTDDGSDVGMDSSGESGYINSYDDTYECKVYIDDVNYKKLEKDEELAVVSLMLDMGSTDIKLIDIPIGQSSLTSDPDKIIINSGTTITLTYVDAEGKPLEDYEVMLGDEEIGETNEYGQVVYSTASSSSVSLSFTAETDDDTASNTTAVTGDSSSSTYEADSKIVERKVKSGIDTIPPVVSYTLSGNTAIITITDNVRVHKAMVNGEEVDMFFPMPSVSHVVPNLKYGTNVIKVLAADANYNYTQKDLVIKLEASIEPVTFTLNKKTEYGTPKLVNETTMVPVRFAEKLGATVHWNQETKTVIYTLGNKVISMTVGNNKAIVNGQTVKLKVAPYLNDVGRTMVPLRMIAQELGFTVNWISNKHPITIK